MTLASVVFVLTLLVIASLACRVLASRIMVPGQDTTSQRRIVRSLVSTSSVLDKLCYLAGVLLVAALAHELGITIAVG